MDSGSWEHRTDIGLKDTGPKAWGRNDDSIDGAPTRLAVIGQEPKLIYPKEDGSFYELSKCGNVWHERMVIPAYDS